MPKYEFSHNTTPLGKAYASEEFSDWGETWLRQGAQSDVLENQTPSTLALHDIEYFILPEHGSRVSFTPQIGFEEGREDSKHQIEFGKIAVNGVGVHKEEDHIALKSFDNTDDLKREWAVSQYLNEINDDQYALLPLGVYKGQGDDFTLMTAYEHNIKSFDNIFWADRNLQPEALRPATIRRHIKLGMQALGMLHGSRVIHHDAQVKNMASDRKSVRFIDLEDAEIIHEDQIDESLSFEKTRRDLDVFIGSLTQVDDNKEYIVPTMRDAQQEHEFVKAYSRGVRKGRATQTGLFIPNFGKENADYIHDTFRKQ